MIVLMIEDVMNYMIIVVFLCSITEHLMLKFINLINLDIFII